MLKKLGFQDLMDIADYLNIDFNQVSVSKDVCKSELVAAITHHKDFGKLVVKVVTDSYNPPDYMEGSEIW